MKILELVCNPRPASFNHALAKRALEELTAQGHVVLFHDLCAEGFDPVMDAGELARGYSLDPLVQAHGRELGEAEGLLILHPDWWGQAPAVLKGWLDRVLRQGLAYELEGGEFSQKTWAPLLGGKKALVLVTTEAAETETKAALETFWTRLVLGKCGMEASCEVLSDVRRIGSLGRARWMRDLGARLAQSFPAGESPRRGEKT
jgi:putative NADPH-quinone reductase